VIGWPGDNFEYVWKHWWVHRAISSGRSPLFNPDVYYPTGFDLAHAELTPLHTFALLPVTALFGATAAYNTAIVGSFVLSGLGAFALARRLTADSWAALFAGAAFAFCSFRLAHLPGHLPLMATWPLPFALLYLERALATARARPAAFAGLFLALSALGSWYIGYAAGLTMVVYAVARGPDYRRLLRPALAFAAVAMLVVLPFAWPYIRLASQGGLRHSVEAADYWSGGLLHLVAPNPMHPLWGRFMPEALRAEFVERLIYLGWVPLALAAVALRRGLDPPVRALAAVAVFCVVLALGTTLRTAGTEGDLGVPMPALALWQTLPMFGSMRNLGRMVMPALLALSVLAAFGLARLRVGRAAAVGLALFVVFESYIAYELSPTAPRPVDAWLAQQERRPLMHYPLGDAISGPQVYYSIHHGQPIAFGYGTHIQIGFRLMMPTLGRFPDPEALDQLRALGVGWVTIRPTAYGAEWPEVARRIEAAPRLRLAADLADTRVYALD
jgi:hypothetical protein